MNLARTATIAALLVLGLGPAVALGACGGGQSTGASADGGRGDGTVEGSSGGDGASGSDANGGDVVIGQDGGQCVPITTCPSTVTCGHFTDPCTGTTMVCGSQCPHGQVCTGSGTTQSCQPPACGGKCGDIGVDSCGVPIVCPGCSTGQACVNNACVTQADAGSAPDAGGCTPLTCMPSTNIDLCGTVTDGCGHTIQCSCPTGLQCIGGRCQTTPLECDTDAGTRCGQTTNACGSGTVQCGDCTGATKCTNGLCMPCTAPSCNGATCGSVNNGCGPTVTCGSCAGIDTCVDGGCCKPESCTEAIEAGIANHCGAVDLGCGVKHECSPCPGTDVCLSDGGCCTPLTCGDAVDAGMVQGCLAVDLGCGVHKNCSPCPGTDVCESDGGCTACIPKTCGDVGNTGCHHDDGCGSRFDCCATGTVCVETLCCAPGDVEYQGSCCKPTCDPNQPPGPQVSCGLVINCAQG